MKQVLSAVLARLGAAANRPLAVQLDHLLDQLTARIDGLGHRVDGIAAHLDAVDGRVERLAARIGGVEVSLGALHRAVEELAAIPSLSTELVEGIAEAEARAAGRLAEVERLLAGR